MWLSVLEGTFGFLFVLGVVTQIIWPLLKDRPLFPMFYKGTASSRKNSGFQQNAKHSGLQHQQASVSATEKIVEGEIISQKSHITGDDK